MKSITISGSIVFNRITEFVINNSVLYFLSCCLLLLGAYSLMHSPWLSGGSLTKYCEIYGIFVLYGVLLAGLCLLVFRRLSMAEDGLVMAGLVLLLVLDPSSFNDLFYTYSLRVGLLIISLSFVLNMSLYVALKKVGGIPWTKTSTVVIALAAGFVSYYPIGLNAAWAGETKEKYFYWLWWMPLLLATLSERIMLDQPQKTDGISKQSATALVSPRLQRRFHLACMLIVFLIVGVHLAESNWAYSLDFYFGYLPPMFLAAGLLHFKLSPTPGRKGQRFLWTYALLALCCSCAPTAPSIVHLPWQVSLSSFHYGFGVVALFCLYFWRIYGHRSWAIAAGTCLTCVVSGSSFSSSLFNISHFHFVPFALLATGFAVVSIIRRSLIFPTLAGGCSVISTLALISIQNHSKVVIFMQVWAVWFGIVHWWLYKRAHPQIYSLIGAFILSLSSMMLCISPHHLAWGADYVIVIISLFLAGWFLGHPFLLTLVVFGILGGAFYLARNQLASIASEFRRVIDFGWLATMLAFLILPFAYFLSVVRMRRREQAETPSQLQHLPPGMMQGDR